MNSSHADDALRQEIPSGINRDTVEVLLGRVRQFHSEAEDEPERRRLLGTIVDLLNEFLEKMPRQETKQ